MRNVHGRICRKEEMNLRLHFLPISEAWDCKNEWNFVESRPIQAGEHHICPCGQNDIQNYFFIENNINGHHTFVGSTCIEHIDPRVGKVIGYFQSILTHPIQGTYKGSDSDGLQMFSVGSNTKLVRGADDIVHHLNPHVIQTKEGEPLVLVKHPKPETLVHEQSYALRLKALYERGHLTFTAV